MLPGVDEGDGWRCDGRRCSSVEDVHVEKLQD
jgi:hypothetical protein